VGDTVGIRHLTSKIPLVQRALSNGILIVQAKLTDSTLVSPDKIFSQYPVSVRWG
jgi:PIN domain nuclease of toxin-antitoxin system